VRRRVLGAAAVAASLAVVTSCGGGGGGSSSSTDGGGEQTLTYWASNQGTSLDNDVEVLQPELDKFEQETGITVELEVIPWDSLLNRILAATTSGQAPDVLNIGNTWSASLQATGAFMPFDDAAFEAIGGQDKFLETSLSSTGAEGETPTSVPLYGLAYALYYNKQMFADAGITEPPATWDDVIAAGQQITDPEADRWGMTIAGASYTESAHFAFIFGKQHGADFIDDQGEANFTTPEAVAAVKQYTDLIAGDQQIVNPSAAQNATTNEAVQDFTSGSAAMIMAQNNVEASFASNGMDPDQYGVIPIPLLDPLPAGGQAVNSHVAGINMSIFEGADTDAALQFVEFMTSPEEQVTLNDQFGSLPVVTEAQDAPEFSDPNLAVYNEVLANTAAALPMIPNESQFETTVGSAIDDLLASGATGQPVTEAEIETAMENAQQQMGAGG